MKTKLAVTVLVLVLLAGALALRTARRATRDRTALEVLVAQCDDLQRTADRALAGLQSAQAAVAKLELQLRDDRSRPGVAMVRADAAWEKERSKPALAARPRSALAIIANDPRKAAEHIKNIREAVDVNYGPVFRRLALSPEQIEKFRGVEAELEQARLDLEAAIDAEGIDPNSIEYKKLWDDHNQTRTLKKAQALGDLARAYIEYVRTESVRDYARSLISSSFIAGQPLTATQIETTGDILIANSPRRKSPDAFPGGSILNAVNWESASEQLKGVLSPVHIEALGWRIEADKVWAKVSERTKLLTAEFKKQAGGR